MNPVSGSASNASLHMFVCVCVVGLLVEYMSGSNGMYVLY